MKIIKNIEVKFKNYSDTILYKKYCNFYQFYCYTLLDLGIDFRALDVIVHYGSMGTMISFLVSADYNKFGYGCGDWCNPDSAILILLASDVL